MSETDQTSRGMIRLFWAVVLVSGLVITDLFLRLFCASWPLVFYLVVGIVGAWSAERLHRRCSGETWGAIFVRRMAKLLSVVSAVGLMLLVVLPVSWDSKCSWRHCGRAFGSGLLKSPFPVGTPTCSGWNRCVNEYPMSRSEYASALRQLRQQGCPAP